MIDDEIVVLRQVVGGICDGFPEVEVEQAQHTTFLVRGRKFAYYLVDHHGDGRVSLQVKAARGDNTALVASDPERFFMPAYIAHHGWVGLYLDAGPVDHDELRELLTDAYVLVAPKRLARQLLGPGS